MATNLELVQSVYAAFAKGDVPSVLSAIDTAIVWIEAENFIYADRNPYVGPEAILNGIFARFATEWEGFAVTPEHMTDAGDTIVVTGRYTGAYLATGKRIDAQFAHIWKVANGKATHFQQYTDTLQCAHVTAKAAGA